MDTVYDHIDFQTIMQTAFIAPVDHGLGLLLVDDEQIPADTRRRLTSNSAYASEYTSGTVPRDFATTYFGQSYIAEELMFGRWVSTAIPAIFRCAAYTVTVATMEAVTDGSYKIAVEDINGGSAIEITGNDFDEDASFSDILATLNTVLHAADSGNYADYDWSIDALGRFVVQNPDDPGPTSKAVTITAGVAGTDITAAAYLNAVNGAASAGLDAESLVEAHDAVSLIDNSWYCIMTSGGTTAQKVALAATVTAERKIGVLLESTATAKDSGDTTDLGYQISALSYARVVAIYSEKTTEYPDAAFVGRNLPALEGEEDWAWQSLSGVTASGSGNGLDSDDKAALDAKNYVYFESAGGVVYAPYGFTASGDEIRLMVGRDWFNDGITVEIFNDHINAKVFAYDAPTFSAIEKTIRKYGGEAIRRGIGVDTAARPFTITLPDPDSFSSTERATHNLPMTKVFKLYLNSSVNDIAITGVWSY